MEPVVKIDERGTLVSLLACRSRSDGKGMFPRVPAHSPAAALYEDIELQGTAKLYSYTVIHPNPKSGKPPFVLALVDYDGNTRVFGRLEHPVAEINIGMSIIARATPSEPDTGEANYYFVSAQGQ